MLEEVTLKQKQYDMIVKNRAIIETLVLSSFLKDLSLYGEYKISEDDFIIDKIKFFYNLGRAISKKHYELDEASVVSFVKDNKNYNKRFNEYGGWEAMLNAKNYGNENNAKAYIDDLMKNNLLLNFHEQNVFFTLDTKIDGMDVNPFELFKEMSCKEVYEYFEGVSSKCSVGAMNPNLQSEGLIIRKDKRKQLKQGVSKGVPYDITLKYTNKEIGLGEGESEIYVESLPQLSTITNGLNGGSGINVFAGHSGLGKTSILLQNFILPMVFRKQRCALFCNENGSLYLQSMLYSFIAKVVFKNRSLTRRKITSGDFSEEEELLMDKIEKFLDDRNFDEYIRFYHMEDFNVDEILRISKGLVTHESFDLICVDTFKSENESSATAYGELVENAKKLDSFSTKYDVKVLLTMQLTTASELGSSYLGAADLSGAKSIKNICNLLFLIRKVNNQTELDADNKAWYLRPYRVVENKRSGGTRREPIKISQEDMKADYRLLFLNKSRSGVDDIVMLLRFDNTVGRFIEVGLCEHVSRNQLRK